MRVIAQHPAAPPEGSSSATLPPTTATATTSAPATTTAAILDRLPDAMLVLREDGTVLHANPSARRLLGRETLAGGAPIGALRADPDRSTILDIARPPRPPAQVALRSWPIVWEGEAARLALLRDITRYARLRRRLRRTTRAATADRERGEEFLAILAHELRNPLMPMLLALDHLRKADADPSAREQARALAEHQARQIGRLLEDLMTFSQLHRGRIQLQKQPLLLRTVMGHAADAVRYQIEEKGQQLTLEPPSRPVWMDADPVWLEQVLVHLLTNASKYTDPGGSILVSADREGEAMVIQVRDDGIGLDAAMLPRVFDLFEQAEPARRRDGGGLGIGLALVRQLVELHGGTVHAESAGPGRGSTFFVRLPLAAIAPVEPSPEGTRPETAAAARRPRSVLIVDDNRVSAEGLVQMLGDWGHVVRTAPDGPSGLVAARAHRPEVVLLDIDLPGLDGYEVARRLRAELGPDAPTLVALTGHDDDPDRRREAGMAHYLMKPFEFDDLARLLDVV